MKRMNILCKIISQINIKIYHQYFQLGPSKMIKILVKIYQVKAGSFKLCFLSKMFKLKLYKLHLRIKKYHLNFCKAKMMITIFTHWFHWIHLKKLENMLKWFQILNLISGSFNAINKNRERQYIMKNNKI